MNPINRLFHTHKEAFILIAILCGALWFRLVGIGWDDNAHLHPDERFLTMVTTNIAWPNSIREYFNTETSPLNPHNKGFSFYVYGTYPVHLVKLISGILQKDAYDTIPIIGRYLSIYADLITCIFVYLLAIYLAKNTRAGLFAALCYATAVLPIQVSHFFTVDPFATLFVTITLYRITQGKINYMTGILAGLAIGAKISTILILPIIGCAAFIHMTARHDSTSPIRKWGAVIRSYLIMTMACALTLRVVYPYLFNGWWLNSRVLANWQELSSFDGPTTSFPPGLQWIGVQPYQPILDMMTWGLGIPLGIIAICSIGYYLFVSIKHNHLRPILIPVSWILIVWIYQSLQFAKPMRYLLPIYPAICVMSGMFLYTIFQRFSRDIHSRYFVILSLCILLLWPLAFVSIYTRQNTRVAASSWIYTHIPENSTIAWEHWDDPLPFAIAGYSPRLYKQIQLPSFDPDDSEKLGKIRDILVQSDYLILSSNRAYGALNRANLRFPITTRFYQKLFSGSLGFTLITQITSRPTIPLPIRARCIHVPGFYYGNLSIPQEQCHGTGIQIVDDYADETFTVYDHPKVLIFRNSGRLSKEDITKRIYE